MKKSLLAFGLLAIGSFQLHGATCSNGTVASVIAGGDCTISNGSNTWTISNFLMSSLPGARPQQSDPAPFTVLDTSLLNVAFANYNNGFSVTITPVGAASSLFGASFNGTVTTNNFFETSFRILGNTGDARITTIGLSLNEASAVVGTGDSGAQANIDLRKFVGTLSPLASQEISVNTLGLPASAEFFTSGNPLNSALVTPNPGDLFVVDRFDAKGGVRVGGSATAAGYTNYFLPTAQTGDIPEPMTFALMGAGLVGLAILRRRQK